MCVYILHSSSQTRISRHANVLSAVDMAVKRRVVWEEKSEA